MCREDKNTNIDPSSNAKGSTCTSSKKTPGQLKKKRTYTDRTIKGHLR